MDHDEAGVDAAGDVGHLRPDVAGVHRHQHPAGVGDGERRDRPVGAVGSPQHDVVARAQPPEQVAGSGSLDAGVQVGVGEGRAVLDVGRVVAEPCRGVADEVGQRQQTKHLLGRVAGVDLSYAAEDEAFRAEIRAWLGDHLTGEWAAVKGLGGPGKDHEAIEERLAWNRHLAEHGWSCPGWPVEHGGRGLSLWQQVIFHEEYARADAPPGSTTSARRCSAPR